MADPQRFAPGDRVQINAKCDPFPPFYDRDTVLVVARVFRDKHTSGMATRTPGKEEWVYEMEPTAVSEGCTTPYLPTLWEHLLKPAKSQRAYSPSKESSNGGADRD